MTDAQNGIRTYVIYGIYHGVNMRAFEQYIIDSVDVLSFWNHLPLLYIVKSKLTTAQLTIKLQTFFEGRVFIVAEMDPQTVGGWLPQAAWEWFRTPAPPTKAPNLSGLFGMLPPPPPK